MNTKIRCLGCGACGSPKTKRLRYKRTLYRTASGSCLNAELCRTRAAKKRQARAVTDALRAEGRARKDEVRRARAAA